MIIHDPLYGTFEVPRFLDRLILAPEVRRLMGVRLLNAPSPSLPTLSEVRRFSHTLGVLRLALLNPHNGLTRDEVRALTATILIHDAATPPFAHLLEYYLKDRAGWDHESALPDLLTGHNLVGNTAHQILPGEQLKFKRLCDASKIDFDLVLQIVRKAHPSSGLLFGALDFDNLDNVLRMAWALGLNTPAVPFLHIARELAVSIEGEMMLSERHTSSVSVWASTRQKVYEILVFDAITVATQAVLTKAISLLFDQKDISDIQWANRDQDFLDLLARSPQTKDLMLRSFNEALPSQIFALRVPGSLSSLGLRSRDAAITLIEKIALEEFNIRKSFGYAFVDKSVFSKKLKFLDPATRNRWTVGETSESVVFYCFSNETDKYNAKIQKPFCEALLKTLGGTSKFDVDSATKNRFAS
jgi:HD superfamily phosphohydrolase